MDIPAYFSTVEVHKFTQENVEQVNKFNSGVLTTFSNIYIIYCI